jgi:hypothetical protein
MFFAFSSSRSAISPSLAYGLFSAKAFHFPLFCPIFVANIQWFSTSETLSTPISFGKITYFILIQYQLTVKKH